MIQNTENLSDEKYNLPISDEEYAQMSKFTNGDIDIATVEFKESTADSVCDRYDIENSLDNGF